MTDNKPTQTQNSPDAIATSTDVETYLANIRQHRSVATGRLIFALDATASRQPTWDTACQLQAEMFREVGGIGALNIQLLYYRGLAECKASRWTSCPDKLLRLMERIIHAFYASRPSARCTSNGLLKGFNVRPCTFWGCDTMLALTRCSSRVRSRGKGFQLTLGQRAIEGIGCRHGTDQDQHDQPHALLAVIGAVEEAHQRAGQN
jgi:hypothetical protein